ncbi:MAG: glutamate synthase-related protein [Syntrophales bacterium]|nr:glutamate synthase-related protein [Syntrophales bacterium]MDD5640698.1 glutamate synthase-related protein [Syntrophales bacterium]
MPAKYHIHVRQVPPRFSPLAKSTIIDWAEGCLRCATCVKEQCPVDAYRKRGFDRSQFVDTIDEMCRDCYRCVQGCPRELIFKAANPQYRQMGDAYWTPEILATTWYQAETGKIPVSGAGYGGPFAGPGFDSFWTDMSEIVRPTRDGIHGREYISTSVDLGRKPMFLTFDSNGELTWPSPPLLELPLPIILAEPPFAASPGGMQDIIIQAAGNLETLAILSRNRLGPVPEETAARLMPSYTAGSLDLDDPLLSQLRTLEILDHPEVLEQIEAVKRRYPKLIVSLKVPADGKVVERVAELTAAGAEVIHIFASEQARGLGDSQDLHLKDLIRRCHLRLVEDRLRDTVTLLVSGGLALAEHVAKAIICGADAVIVDLPLLLALECRLCRSCAKGGKCPVEIETLTVKRGAQRVINLIGAWNNQLLEIMGAMGMREVRRLRGEVGRAMFIEDLEKEIFAPLFANREVETIKREPN